jgi:hypothetical protein
MPFQRLTSQNAAAVGTPIPAYVAYTCPRSASERRRRKARARERWFCDCAGVDGGKGEQRTRGRVRERRSIVLLSWRVRIVVSGERGGGGDMAVVVVL